MDVKFFITVFVTIPQIHPLNISYTTDGTTTPETDDGIWIKTRLYCVIALFILIFAKFFLIFCCTRLKNSQRYQQMKRNIKERLGCFSTSDAQLNQNNDNNPPAYDNTAMEGVHFIVIRSPPYVKDPPPYTEAYIPEVPTQIGMRS